METKTNKTNLELMPLEMVRDLMIREGVDKAPNVTKAWNSKKTELEEKYNYRIPSSARIRIYYKMSVSEILGIKDKHLNVKDVILVMIENNYSGTEKSWREIAENYNSKNKKKIPKCDSHIKYVYGKSREQLLSRKSPPIETIKNLISGVNITSLEDANKFILSYNKNNYSKIPSLSNFKSVYGLTFHELYTGHKTSEGPFWIKNKIYPPKDLFIKILKDNNINSLKDYTELADKYNSNESEIYYLPDSYVYRKLYSEDGKPAALFGLLGDHSHYNLGKIPMDKEKLIDYMKSQGVETEEDWISVAKEFNKRSSDVYITTDFSYNKKFYGETILSMLGKDPHCSKRYSYMPLSDLIELIKKNKLTVKSWNSFVTNYNNNSLNTLKIPNRSTIKSVYGLSCGEIINGRFGIFENIHIVRFIRLHLEDLIYLDKSQLLQIGFLEKLPKDIYKEILDCPKGESRKKLLENIPDRLNKSKEEVETFESILNRVIENDEGATSKEESNFEDNLHIGLDILKRANIYDPKESVNDIFREIKSLDNFEEGDYKGPEAIDYIVSSEVQKLWNAIIRIPDPSEAMKLIEEYMLKKNGSKFFNEITGVFMSQYQGVTEMKIPEGYSFPFTPLMMQKLTAYMISTKKQFANWSETGTGKTISGVLTSRYIDSRVTLIIAVNSTIGNWTINSIKVAYPDSKVYTKKDISGNTKLDRNFHNYVVTNYEEFQNPQKFLDKWRPFLKNNKIDFVILDEVQKVKSITGNSISIRRGVIENLLQDIDLQHGRNLKNEGRIVPVLALSATPVINSLSEGLSILSLLKGTNFEPNKRTTRRSALACHFDIVRNGIRLVEELPATERLITLPVKRGFKDLSGLADNWNLLNKIDTAGCLTKIGECIRKGYLKKGTQTIIYTDLVTDVIDNITQYLRGFGFRVGEFTGRNGNLREEEMKDFISGQYDVLIASKPISTGVDGLQYVCNRMIILIPAWTYAEYHQLVGRINRKGTQYKEVEIIIPTIEYINENGKIWSLDNYRLSKIWFKKTLDDVVMNGNIPDEIITWSKAYELARKSLKEFLKNGNTKGSYEKPVLATEIKPVERKPRVRGNRNQRDYFSEFQGLNQRISTTTIENVFTKILGTKDDWVRYHELRDKAIGNIQDQAINTIARDILKSRKHKVLGDMGCGMNQLKTLLPENYEVISVDMYAADDTVKICNILDTSSIIPDGSLDIAVYSLSLWGRDWRNILDDAYRALDYDGKIVIVEPLSSSSKSIDKVKAALNERRFTNISVMTDAGNKYYYMTANK